MALGLFVMAWLSAVTPSIADARTNLVTFVYQPNSRWTPSYKQIWTISTSVCCRQCVRDDNCVSINYLPSEGLCELNEGNSTSVNANVTSASDWSLLVIAGCPTGWLAYRERCYYYTTTPRNWADTVNYCRTYGAQLIEFENKEENDFALSLLKNINIATGVWIGLTDVDKPGLFRWGSGAVAAYTNFAAGEPSHFYGEHCVEMRKMNNRWNDVPCSKLFHGICEMAMV